MNKIEFLAKFANEAVDTSAGLLATDGAGNISSTASIATPAQFDNDTSIATTAFVNQFGVSSAGLSSYSSVGTISIQDIGKIISITGTTYTLTLPAISSAPAGSILMFRTSLASTDVVTLAAAGTDVISCGNGQDGRTNIALKNGYTLTLMSDGIGGWLAINGIAHSEIMFGSSLASNGYQKLPSGTIMQWGTNLLGATINVDLVVTFPIAFTTLCHVYCQSVFGGSTYSVCLLSSSTTTFSIHGNVANLHFNWFAIGY